NLSESGASSAAFAYSAGASRETDDEGRPQRAARLPGHGASVRRHDLLHDVEAQSQPARAIAARMRGIALRERLEEKGRAIGGGFPAAGCDRHAQRAGASVRDK